MIEKVKMEPGYFVLSKTKYEISISVEATNTMYLDEDEYEGEDEYYGETYGFIAEFTSDHVIVRSLEYLDPYGDSSGPDDTVRFDMPITLFELTQKIGEMDFVPFDVNLVEPINSDECTKPFEDMITQLVKKQ